MLSKIDSKKLGAVLIVILFIFSAILSNVYKEQLQGIVGEHHLVGGFIYIVLVVISAVIAPINALPLLPVVSVLWGPVNAALLSIVGWTLGSIVIYWLLKKYGRPFVGRFVNLKEYEEKQLHIPEKNKFWILVGLRMIIPVDVLSYILGIFVPMSWKLYISTTIIGITPFAFILAYSSILPIMYQVIAGIIGVIILIFGVVSIRKFYK